MLKQMRGIGSHVFPPHLPERSPHRTCYAGTSKWHGAIAERSRAWASAEYPSECKVDPSVLVYEKARNFSHAAKHREKARVA